MIQDKLSRYLRQLDASDQEKEEERDRYINLLFMRNFKDKPKAKTKYRKR